MIKITLSAANMGPYATEADFDAWAAYVDEHIGEATGLACDVEQAGFTGRTAIPADEIDAPTNEQAETIERWLSHEGWGAWCASMSAQKQP